MPESISPSAHAALTRRLGILLGGIALLALAGMVSSIVVTEASRGDAAAVNLAGSLRMQAYRIAARLLAGDGDRAAAEAEGFEARLLRLAPVVADGDAAARRRAYAQIRARWDALKLRLGGAAHAAEVEALEAFVAEIDRFVTLLERGAEAKLGGLHWLEIAVLAASLVLTAVAWREVRRDVLPPLRELLGLAERVRRGDFGGRAGHLGADELGVLGVAFNAMAADLSAMYADLQARVDAQTAALRRSHRSLELLYATTRRLSEAPPEDASLEAVLLEVARFTGAGCVRLELGEGGRALVAPSPAPAAGADRGELAAPVEDQGQRFGTLRVSGGVCIGQEAALLETVARHIAASLRANRQQLSQRRLALLEERNVIARELHDSLAQTLSYLKIQVSCLQSALPPNPPAPVAEHLAELREGLNGAYRELRELLTTFRITMADTGLQPALARALEEFGRRGGLATRLEFRLDGRALSPHQEIHVLQIVREALSNIVHHAQARSATVELAGQGERIRVYIDDDGVGVPANPERERHYGLTIMRERARSLRGEIRLAERPGGGCRVELDFPAATAEPCAEEIRSDA